jgi:hypothetical protein
MKKVYFHPPLHTKGGWSCHHAILWLRSSSQIENFIVGHLVPKKVRADDLDSRKSTRRRCESLIWADLSSNTVTNGPKIRARVFFFIPQMSSIIIYYSTVIALAHMLQIKYSREEKTFRSNSNSIFNGGNRIRSKPKSCIRSKAKVTE